MASGDRDKGQKTIKQEDNVIHVNFGAPKKEDAPPKEATVDPLSAEKLAVFKEYLELGTTMVTLDARPEEVIIPPQFKESMAVNLNFDYRYNLPDFAFDGEGVSASLSFGGKNFWCSIPWTAVYALRNQEAGEFKFFHESEPS